MRPSFAPSLPVNIVTKPNGIYTGSEGAKEGATFFARRFRSYALTGDFFFLFNGARCVTRTRRFKTKSTLLLKMKGNETPACGPPLLLRSL
jgi:hypothetical protein